MRVEDQGSVWAFWGGVVEGDYEGGGLCGNEALAQSYPQLFTLAGHKNAKVCEVWDSSMGQGGWNLSLARDFNDWEMDQIGIMLNLLKDFRTSLEEDSVRWKREGNGVFGPRGPTKF
ncbi:hypothetical protein CK203_004553 [Vitis vinifera]|uniref:Uncharacterized protein n=1 Tax=Vitis vinifera TaxID=29760 RepID=A0A438KGH5_VITVI|nr:hypothetical protein CK203_004553 [Vitis vinifera]